MCRKKGHKGKVEPLKKEEAQSAYSGVEFHKIVGGYIDTLQREGNLYKNELRRALERYEEKREPVFYVNGISISPEELPLVVKKVMFEERRVNMPLFGVINEMRNHMMDMITRFVYWLQHLPGARVPARPEIVERWFKEK